jgi:hypothetical protein
MFSPSLYSGFQSCQFLVLHTYSTYCTFHTVYRALNHPDCSESPGFVQPFSKYYGNDQPCSKCVALFIHVGDDLSSLALFKMSWLSSVLFKMTWPSSALFKMSDILQPCSKCPCLVKGTVA